MGPRSSGISSTFKALIPPPFSYPARIRTWKNRTKTCCDTVSPPGSHSPSYRLRGEGGSLAGARDLTRGLLDLVGQVLELDAQIDGDQADMRRDDQGQRSEIEDAADAAGDQEVGHPLRGLGRDAQEGQADLPWCQRFAQGFDRLDNQPVVVLADLLRVVLEQGNHLEAARPETPILQQGPTEVPHADQRQRPLPVDPQDVPQGVDQLVDAVSDPGMSELAEEREILADLRVLDRQRLAELAAGDGGAALVLIGLQLPQVQADPPHHGLGGHLPSRRLPGSVTHRAFRDGESCRSDTGSGPMTRSMPSPRRLYRSGAKAVKVARCQSAVKPAWTRQGCGRRPRIRMSSPTGVASGWSNRIA